jgi:hypothetical protein
MKFLPSFKSAKSLALAAVAIATAIAGNITPSQASQPNFIMSTPGQPDLAVFGNERKVFKIGCPELRNVWGGIETTEYPLTIYQQVISNFGGVAGELFCNNPRRVKGYISPAFDANTGVLVTDGKPFFVKSGEFYKAMGITPTLLNQVQGNFLIQRHPQIKSNPILEPKTASGTAIPIPTKVAKP